MKLSDVKTLKEAYSDSDANKCLKEGYQILKIISSRSTTADLDEVRPCYILGKSK